MELKINDVAIPSEIVFNYDELKAELIAKAHDYEMMVYSDDQIKLAKADKATLNKLKKALNDERIRREREYMEPFNQFKAKINEVISIIDRPIAVIDSQIKSFEELKKAQKLEEIKAYFGELITPAWLDFDQIFDQRWLNATYGIAAVKEDIQQRLKKIASDLSILDELEYSFEAKSNYFMTLDVNRAIAEGKRLADIARQKKEYEERQKAQEAAKQAAPEEKPTEVVNPIPEPVKPEEKPNTVSDGMWITFRCCLTVEQARELKEFFNNRGIPFERA